MTNYQPGTVAIATVRGVPDVRVFCYQDVHGRATLWDSARPIDGVIAHDDKDVTDISPLVVLDLGAGDALALIADLRQFVGTGLAKSVAEQIEAQTKPPRISEPGLWGVVEAKVDDGGMSSGTWEWIRFGLGWTNHHGFTVSWSKLVDPALVREGVES